MNEQLARKIARGFAVLCAVAALSACNDDRRFETSIAAARDALPATSKRTVAVVQNTRFDFKPEVGNRDGAELRFSVTGKPDWTTFRQRTGRLSGTPTEAEIGMTWPVEISVINGPQMRKVAAFEIKVVAYGTEQVTLVWQPPSSNEDGTPLTDLAGTRIYWGTIKGEFPNVIDVDNPGVSNYVVDNLVPNTYYFATTAYNSAGMESELSNLASTTIR
ncbi:MAG: putative Ig domain-containing protein [Gammaproteobacteria bacterium]